MSLEMIPTVSVIVPNYNHARYLRRRIDSILAQTHSDFELILLDDCSTDDSREILELYAKNPKVRIEYNAKNSGSAFKQWNKGAQMARGRYVWIAESDDYADPRLLARMVAILEEQPEVTFAYCRSLSVGEDDAVLFRKDVYERVGMADERLRVCGDYKLWAATALEGKIAYVAEPLNYFRSHGGNVRTSMQAGALDACEYYYAMLWVLQRIGAADTLTRQALVSELLRRAPSELSPTERIETCKRSLACVEDWNLRHNRHVPQEVMRLFFRNLRDILVFREFAVTPPGRWRFFAHRWRFYWHSFAEMGWKGRFVNLMRVLGAPVVGYRHRHWAERVYARAMQMVDVR